MFKFYPEEVIQIFPSLYQFHSSGCCSGGVWHLPSSSYKPVWWQVGLYQCNQMMKMTGQLIQCLVHNISCVCFLPLLVLFFNHLFVVSADIICHFHHLKVCSWYRLSSTDVWTNSSWTLTPMTRDFTWTLTFWLDIFPMPTHWNLCFKKKCAVNQLLTMTPQINLTETVLHKQEAYFCSFFHT